MSGSQTARVGQNELQWMQPHHSRTTGSLTRQQVERHLQRSRTSSRFVAGNSVPKDVLVSTLGCVKAATAQRFCVSLLTILTSPTEESHRQLDGRSRSSMMPKNRTATWFTRFDRLSG